MAPTIRKGETFVWRKFVPGEGKKLVRGDIVVFEYPPDAAKTVLYVKRVIGLPGETVRIVDDVVQIDGRPVEEPWEIL